MIDLTKNSMGQPSNSTVANYVLDEVAKVSGNGLTESNYKISRSNNLYFPRPVSLSNKELDLYNHAASSAALSVIYGYMKRYYQREVSVDTFTYTARKDKPIPDYMADIARSIRRIVRLTSSEHTNIISDGGCDMRIYSGEISAILHSTSVTMDAGKLKGIQAVMLIHKPVITEVYILDIRIKDGNIAVLEVVPGTIFYIAKKQSDVQKYISDQRSRVNALQWYTDLVKCVSVSLHTLLDQIDTPRESLPYPKHTESEMFAIHTVLDGMDVKYNAHSIENFAYLSEDSKQGMGGFEEFEDIGDKLVDRIVNRDWDIEWPLVDLNLKEWEYISRYPKEILPEILNLPLYLQQSRYGSELRMPCALAREYAGEFDGREMLVSYFINTKNDIIRFYLVDLLTPTIGAQIIIDIDHVSSFSIDRSIRSIQKTVMYRQPDEMSDNIDDVLKISPLLAATEKELLDMIEKIISLFIVIHERPERTRMVRRTETVKIRKPSQPHEEPEFVVTRILKPAKEVRAYIEEMTQHDIGRRRKAEYVIESWNRIGHWRRCKSGKIVWIEPTTCVRHKALTGKEIHIQL